MNEEKRLIKPRVRKIFKRNSKDKIDKEGETIDEQEGKEKA